MIILKFNTDKPDTWLSPLDFPITIVNEQGVEYKIIQAGEDGFTCIKPKPHYEDIPTGSTRVVARKIYRKINSSEI